MSNGHMAEKREAELGAVQKTLFIPLAARARETGRKHPALRDPKADGWLDAVEKNPGPYFFVSEGVLVYLQEADVTDLLARIAKRFPGARIAFDTYPRQTFERQHKLAAKRGLPARWAWSCDDPSSLEGAGLKLIESAWITRPPNGLRSSLPARFRYLLPAADPFLRQAFTLSLFPSGDPSNGTSIAR